MPGPNACPAGADAPPVPGKILAMRVKPKESLAAVDRLQRRVPWLAFPVAVWKKFGDDQAGNLAALIAYYGFISIFPILLVAFTVLNLVLHNDAALRKHLISSALDTYPIIGTQLKGSVHPIGGSGIALVIGLVLALLGARGVAAAVRNAFDVVWAVPKERRPAFPWSVLRGAGFIVVVGAGQAVTGYLSSVASGVGHVVTGFAFIAGVILVSFVLNIGFFWLSFRLSTASEVSWKALGLGAVLSAAFWQVLQLAGGYVVGHKLHGSELYGTFGIVLGLLAWLYLQAQVTLYAVEICTVRVWRLWPRGLAKPLTEQDTFARQRYQQRDALK
jgi:membrane protein